jgi:hypothetical protein
MRIIRNGVAFLIFAVALSTNLNAQQVFEREAVTVSNLGVSFTNVGTIGNPNISNVPTGVPSLEYPKNSGTEHLFEAGIWLGALVEGQIRVSTSAVTNSAGYTTGTAGFEFTNDGLPFNKRSSLERSENFSPVAISQEDFIAQFTDRNTSVGNNPIAGHDNPLFADIQMESYNWSFGFAEALTIIKYEITNNGQADWENFYFSMYSDMVVRNVNTTLEGGGAFYNKGGMGWVDSTYTLYVFDRASADEKQNTYASSTILGSEYRGIEFHPRRADEVEAAGYQVPSVSPDFWLFGAGAGDFSRPNDDLERYNDRMADIWPLEQYRERLREDGANSAGNFIQLNTIGPFPEIAAGETVSLYVAFVTALMPDEFQSILPADVPFGDADQLDNEESRENLIENVGWAYRLFDGQENEDGSRDRFLVPEPPITPNMRVELEAGAAVVYWDDVSESSVDPVTDVEDFAGYKLYRTQLGDDLEGTIGSDAQVLREWDVKGDDIGFETGFDNIRLQEPVTFPGDEVEYTYRYEISGMLSGWQYLFAVSAFDQGDDRTPPLETSVNANSVRVFPGTPPNENFGSNSEEYAVGVYPNPYRINAAWDGSTPFTRKIMFFNLPAQAQVRIYTLAGEIVATLDHDAATYNGDSRWFNDFSSDNRIMAGGEHAWDLLSEANQNLTTGLYLYTVRNKNSGEVQRGKFAVIK